MTTEHASQEVSSHRSSGRDRLIRLPEVLRIVGVAETTWRLLIAKGQAPASIQITPRCVAWSERECLDWVQKRIQAARGQ